MNWRSVPIQQVIEKYSGVELKPKGRELWGLCPFHADNWPSLCVNAQKGVWLCRSGCGGGSSADFLMKLKQIDFKTAAAMIEVDFGTGRSWQPVKRVKSPEMLLDERLAQVVVVVHNQDLAGIGHPSFLVLSRCIVALRFAIAETGGDCVSVGALTHSAAVLDLAMDFV